jgi:hypothetical protein
MARTITIYFIDSSKNKEGSFEKTNHLMPDKSSLKAFQKKIEGHMDKNTTVRIDRKKGV